MDEATTQPRDTNTDDGGLSLIHHRTYRAARERLLRQAFDGGWTIAIGRVIDKGRTIVIDHCPRCGEEHRHGTGWGSGSVLNSFGHRVPHCVPIWTLGKSDPISPSDSVKGYIIVPPDRRER